MEASIAKTLQKPFSEKEIDQIPRSGIKLDYVGHAAVTARLLEADNDWAWEPVAFNENGAPLITKRGDQAVMWIRLTIGGVTRLGVGIARADKPEIEKELIGDAIRNAAMRFGVALDLWRKHDTTDPIAGSQATASAAKVQKTRSAPEKQPASSSQTALSGDDAWQDILLNTDGWFDNRAEKATGSRNANYPDFKAKRGNAPFDTMGTNREGQPDSLALWLNAAPEEFKYALEALDAGDDVVYEPAVDFVSSSVTGNTVEEASKKLKAEIVEEFDPEKEPF